jgi:hypothetical protein
MLAVVMLDDEAERWLRVIRDLSNLSPYLSQKLVRNITRKTWTGFTIVGCFYAYCGAVNLFSHSQYLDHVRYMTGNIILGAMGVIAAAFLGLQIVTIVSQSILRRHRFGFGGEKVLDNWLSDISVSETPIGVPCEVYTTSSFEQGLKHSQLYREPEIASVICNWIIRVSRKDEEKSSLVAGPLKEN